MAWGMFNSSRRICAMLVAAIFLLSHLASATSAQASVASLDTAQIEEELQVRRTLKSIAAINS